MEKLASKSFIPQLHQHARALRSSVEVTPGYRVPLAVLKSLLQKAQRQGASDCVRSVCYVIVRSLQASYVSGDGEYIKRTRTGQKSILTNLINRLWVVAIEEGSLLLLHEDDRRTLVDAYLKVRVSTIDNLHWAPFAALCDLLARCTRIQWRVISQVWALQRLIQYIKADKRIVADSLTKEGVGANTRARLFHLSDAYLREDVPFPYPEGVKVPIADGDSVALSEFGKSKVVPKNAEFAKRRMLDVGRLLVRSNPDIFGWFRFETNGVSSPPLESSLPGLIPTPKRMREMHEIDRHAGGNRGAWSKHEFALTGALIADPNPGIRPLQMPLPGRAPPVPFTSTELERLYVVEKRVEVMMKRKKPTTTASPPPRDGPNNTRTSTSTTSTTSTKITTSVQAVIGFKDWTLRVTDRAQARTDFPFLHQAVLQHIPAGAPPVLFMKHGTRDDEIHTVCDSILSTPRVVRTIVLTKEQYAPVNGELQARLLPHHAYEKKVRRATTKSAREKTHYIVVQPFVPLTRLCDYSKKTKKLTVGFGDKLLAHMIVNYLVPLSDFNGTNIGIDEVTGEVYRYDLNEDANIPICLRRRAARGFATAQRFNKKLRESVHVALEQASETQIRAIVARTFKQLGDMSPGSRMAERFLAFARRTDLGTMFATVLLLYPGVGETAPIRPDGGPSLRVLCKHLLTLAGAYRKI